MHRAVVLSVLLVVTCVFAVNPGVKTTLSENGLDYIKDVGVQIIQKQLATVTLPDISGNAGRNYVFLVLNHYLGTPIGSIDYTLKNIVLTGLTIPSVSTTIVPGQGIAVSVYVILCIIVVESCSTGVSCHVHLDWHYREHSWPHISDGGSADVSVSSISVLLL